MTSYQRSALFATTAIICMAMPAQAQAQGQTKSFDVPAQPVASAISALGRQADIQIVAAKKLTRGKTSRAIKGSMTVEQALAAMLGGTGLEARRIGASSFTIVPNPNVGGVPADAAAQPQDAVSSGEDEGSAGQEIVVTGTNIRNGKPVGSNVETFTRADIDKTGASSLEQFARTVSGNVSNTDVIANAGSTPARYAVLPGDTNPYSGSAFNLRGLGPSSTLVLIDGHRVAADGDAGSFVDISQVPLSAIARVEILRDSASAIYGTDAVGGVVNIITRRDFTGAESQARYQISGRGDAGVFNGSQSLGGTWDGGDAFVGYNYTDSKPLDASDRDYIPTQGGPYYLIPEARRHSVFASARQSLGTNIQLSATGNYSNNRTRLETSVSSTGFVYRQSLKTKTEQYGGTFGATAELGESISATVLAGISRSESNQATDTVYYEPAVPGNVRESGNVTETDFIDVGANGELLSFKDRAIRFAVGGSYRREFYKSIAGGAFEAAARNVVSGYGELLVPVIKPDDAVRLARSLEFSAAGRYDRYSDTGGTFNTRLGIGWQPFKPITIRGTYGTAFRAPLLSQIGLIPRSAAYTLPDPTVAGQTTRLLLVSGGNSQLRPQTAKTFTGGIDYRSGGFSVSVDYYNIDYKDQISPPPALGGIPSIFTSPVLAPFLVRNPNLSDVQGFFNSPGFGGDNTFSGLGAAGIQAIYFGNQTNLAKTTISGLNLKANYSADVFDGHLNLSGYVDHILNMRLRPTQTAPAVSVVNTFGEPPSWRGRGSVSWSKPQYSATFTTNFTGEYTNNIVTPRDKIASLTTFDLTIEFRPGANTETDENAFRFGFSVTNLTNKRPPFVAFPLDSLLPGQNPIPFDPVNASPLGRVFSVNVSKRW